MSGTTLFHDKNSRNGTWTSLQNKGYSLVLITGSSGVNGLQEELDTGATTLNQEALSLSHHLPALSAFEMLPSQVGPPHTGKYWPWHLPAKISFSYSDSKKREPLSPELWRGAQTNIPEPIPLAREVKMARLDHGEPQPYQEQHDQQ